MSRKSLELRKLIKLLNLKKDGKPFEEPLFTKRYKHNPLDRLIISLLSVNY